MIFILYVRYWILKNDIEKVVLSAEQIEGICKRLGEQISHDYEGKNPLFIGLLKGCEPFISDLLKFVSIYCQIEYMRVSSYEGTLSSGHIIIKSDITCDLTGRDVIVVDDIVDTGRTTLYIRELLKKRGAKSVAVCCLLDKPEGRLVDVDVEYIGDNIPKEFVVGYGLDYNERYRNLPYIGILKEEIYK